MTRFLTTILAGTLLAMASPAQLNGTLIMKDGRRQEAPRIEQDKDNYTLIYAHGNINVPKKLVSRAIILDAAGTVPADASAEEKKKFAKGLVPIDGKWVSRKQAKKLLARRQAKIKKAMTAAKERSKWHSRANVKTKHFEFDHTLPDDVAKGYMDFFEEYWDVFAKQWKIKQPAKLGKLKVCMYSNMADFNRIGNVPKGVMGYFFFGKKLELNFFHDRRDPKYTRAILWHECNHYLMHLYVQPKVHNPGWLEEGLAEYYGGSSYDPKKKVMTPGLIQEGRLVRLQDAMAGNDFQKLEPLMKLKRISAMQYAWSWAMVHMLFSKKRYTKGFKKFITKLAKDKKLSKESYGGDSRWVKPDTQIKLFKNCLKIKKLADLEKEWYEYIKGMKVGSAHGYYRAAMDCERYQRPLRAGMYYKKAIELDENYLPPYEAYANLLFDEGETGKAKAIIDKGLKLDPINPGFYLLKAKVAKKSDDPKKAERLCNLAMDLAPDDVMLRYQVVILLD